MTIWLYVTHDKYEWILEMADSQEALARKLGKSANTIASSMSHARHRGMWSPYRRVEVEEDD